MVRARLNATQNPKNETSGNEDEVRVDNYVCSLPTEEYINGVMISWKEKWEIRL